jgi:hypothetical protein
VVQVITLYSLLLYDKIVTSLNAAIRHKLWTLSNTSSAGIIRSLAPGNAAMGIRIIKKHLREKQNNREKSEL